jgi:hypothetical protein
MGCEDISRAWKHAKLLYVSQAQVASLDAGAAAQN